MPAVVNLTNHPRTGTTRPPARRLSASGDIVPLRPWTPAERKVALLRLVDIVDADPRGRAMTAALRASIARYE